jgi:hypothetical protein
MTKLVAVETIKYGPTRDDKGNEVPPKMAMPGETFEIDEKIYPDAADQLLELGHAAKPGSPEAAKAKADADAAKKAAPAATPAPAAPAHATGTLPDDFPGRAALAAEGIDTYAKLRAYGDVTAVPGVGAATAAKISAALADADAKANG